MTGAEVPREQDTCSSPTGNIGSHRTWAWTEVKDEKNKEVIQRVTCINKFKVITGLIFAS